MDSPWGAVEKGAWMATKRGKGKETLDLDGLMEEIMVDAYGDDEPLWAFR